MIVPLDVATSGYLDSPLSVAVDGYLSLAGAPIPPKPPTDGGGAGGGGEAPYSRGRYYKMRRKQRIQQGDEDFITIAIEAIKFLLGR